MIGQIWLRHTNIGLIFEYFIQKAELTQIKFDVYKNVFSCRRKIVNECAVRTTTTAAAAAATTARLI